MIAAPPNQALGALGDTGLVWWYPMYSAGAYKVCCVLVGESMLLGFQNDSSTAFLNP